MSGPKGRPAGEPSAVAQARSRHSNKAWGWGPRPIEGSREHEQGLKGTWPWFLARARSEGGAEPSAVAEAPVAGATGMGVGSPCHYMKLWGPARTNL